MLQGRVERAVPQWFASLTTRMKHIVTTAFAALVFTSNAADTPVAVVKGTNVLCAGIIEPLRFDPTKIATGASNVVISASEVSVIGPGWRYNPATGEFTQPDGKPIANGTKARIDRAKLIDSAYVKLQTMQTQGANAVANWASLSASQKDAAQKATIDAAVTMARILELLLLEQRALLEAKDQ